MKKNILVTWKPIKNYLDYKKNKTNLFNFDYLFKKQSLKESDLSNIIHKYDGIICGDDEINFNILNKAKKLKVISKWGTGIDSIDLATAKKKNIKVFNCPSAFTKQVATYAIGIIILLSRSFIESNRSIQKGLWQKYAGFDLKGKIVGIIGFGKIGQEIQRHLKSFEVNFLINDTDRSKKKLANKKKLKVVTLDILLKKSDIIILSANLNSKSHNLINVKNIYKIKKKPILINIARGPLIQEKALLVALERNILSKVGLDVFENEPFVNKKLLKYKNSFFSAHNAYHTIEAKEKTNIQVFQNLIKGFK